jgi:molecular chaperone GrpE (heat shock protein)
MSGGLEDAATVFKAAHGRKLEPEDWNRSAAERWARTVELLRDRPEALNQVCADNERYAAVRMEYEYLEKQLAEARAEVERLREALEKERQETQIYRNSWESAEEMLHRIIRLSRSIVGQET